MAPTPQIWRQTLGVTDAARFTGFTTKGGQVLLGPAVTRGLETLRAARRPRARPSRADLDRMAMAAAVLLHETIHATGPRFVADLRRTRSGRALEEGFTEAVTVDLLRAYVAELRLPAPLTKRLQAAARRYRPAYPEQVQWARRMSAEVTKRSSGTPRARAWRAMVADRWGTDRWVRLGSATGRPESALRASAAEDLGPRGPVPGVGAD